VVNNSGAGHSFRVIADFADVALEVHNGLFLGAHDTTTVVMDAPERMHTQVHTHKPDSDIESHLSVGHNTNHLRPGVCNNRNRLSACMDHNNTTLPAEDKCIRSPVPVNTPTLQDNNIHPVHRGMEVLRCTVWVSVGRYIWVQVGIRIPDRSNEESTVERRMTSQVDAPRRRYEDDSIQEVAMGLIRRTF